MPYRSFCSGGRGCGATANVSPNGPVKLVAVAELFEDRLANGYQVLSEKYQSQVDVPPDRRLSVVNGQNTLTNPNPVHSSSRG